MSRLLQLKQERYAIVQQMEPLSKSAHPADAQRWRELNLRAEHIGGQIVSLEESLETQESINRFHENHGAEEHRVSTPLDLERSTPEYRAAFNAFIRTGKAPELRTYTPLGSVGGADGSTLVPVGFQREVEKAMKSFAGMLAAPTRKLATSQGNPMTWPTEDDTANNGRWVAENAAVSQTNPTFSSITLNSFLASSDQVLIPIQLIQDSGVDVEANLIDSFASRLGRLLNAGFTTGTGTGQPSGILDGTVGVPGFTSGSQIVTAVGANSNSGDDGDTDLNSVGSDDFANLMARIDPAYRALPSCGFMFNSTTLNKLLTTKDKFGRPLLDASVGTGVPKTIFGFPWFLNQAMPNIGASAYSVAFGAWEKYVIRTALGLSVVRFNETFMSNHQIGFQAFTRVEGKLLQPRAFALLQTPAS
jgi:HK97 family phage major capsid protein